MNSQNTFHIPHSFRKGCTGEAENGLYNNGIFMQCQQVTEALKQKMDMILLKGGTITSITSFFARISSQVQGTFQNIKE